MTAPVKPACSCRDTDRRATVLIVDDQEMIRSSLARLLAARGYEVLPTGTAREALTTLASRDVDLVLTDLHMPGMGGLEFLGRAKAMVPGIPLIVVTGYASIDSAVEAMKLGACDYVAKPYDSDEVLLRIERALNEHDLSLEVRALREALRAGYDVGRGAHLIGASSTMLRVFDVIAKVARNSSSVLIQGETGTGKELVARAIHCSGPRAAKPFVALNCGGISRSLLESALFGHVKGAFTGAIKDNPGYFVAAEGGTLLLDEITEVDADMQVKLLRALQEREATPVGGTKPIPFDARIVAATNRDARRAVEEGVLRQDLYYRLAVVVIDLPPLRERTRDIGMLVNYFNARLSAEYGIAPRRIPETVLCLLQRHRWPGNVRELENVMERAFVLGNGPAMAVEDLPPEISRVAGAQASACLRVCDSTHRQAPASPVIQKGPREPGFSHPDSRAEPLTLAECERTSILRALETAGGNKVKAARILSIDRKRLYRLLHKHGLMPRASAVTSDAIPENGSDHEGRDRASGASCPCRPVGKMESSQAKSASPACAATDRRTPDESR